MLKDLLTEQPRCWEEGIAVYQDAVSPSPISKHQVFEEMAFGHLNNGKILADFGKCLSVMRFLKEGAVYLDLGCHDGKMFEFLYRNRRHFSYLGVDLDFTQLHSGNSIKSKLDKLFLLSDPREKLPIASGSVQLITAFDIVDYIDSCEEFFKEIYRVLSVSGVCLVSSTRDVLSEILSAGLVVELVFGITASTSNLISASSVVENSLRDRMQEFVHPVWGNHVFAFCHPEESDEIGMIVRKIE